MTAPVGSAALSGAEAIVQSSSGKTSAGPRGHVKHAQSDDTGYHSDDAPQSSYRSEIDASDAHLEKAGKVSKRKHEREKSDKDGNSFEHAFDRIDKDEPKDTSQKVNVAPPGLPEITVRMPSEHGASLSKTNAKQMQLETHQGAVRTMPLLQQKSILALMDARDRLLTNAHGPKSDSLDVGMTEEQFAAQAEDITEVSTMTVDRRETHWNFNADARSMIDAQVSSLHAQGRNLSQVSSLPATASTNVPKEKTLESKSLVDVQQQASPQSVDMSGADQSASRFLDSGGKEHDSSTPFQKPAAPIDQAERKSGRTQSSSSLDAIFTTPTRSQNTSGATEQVRNGVVDSLASNKLDANASASTIGSPNRPTPVPVMRTLDLTLSPADLGSVKLRLSLKENSLSIEAETSKASTAKLLSDDRANLERGLKDAGYDVASMKISDASASTSSNTSGSQTSGFPSRDTDQSRSDFAGRQGDGMQRREGSMPDQSQRRARQDSAQTAPVDGTSGRLGNGVYI